MLEFFCRHGLDIGVYEALNLFRDSCNRRIIEQAAERETHAERIPRTSDQLRTQQGVAANHEEVRVCADVIDFQETAQNLGYCPLYRRGRKGQIVIPQAVRGLWCR